MVVVWFVLGLVLAGGYVWYARAQKQGEEQVLAIGLIGAALVYVLFAILWADPPWLWWELLGVVIYGAVAIIGWRTSPLWLGVGWGLHAVWDAGLHLIGGGAEFAPEWYVIACISFDLLVAGYIFVRFRNPKQFA